MNRTEIYNLIKQFLIERSVHNSKYFLPEPYPTLDEIFTATLKVESFLTSSKLSITSIDDEASEPHSTDEFIPNLEVSELEIQSILKGNEIPATEELLTRLMSINSVAYIATEYDITKFSLVDLLYMVIEKYPASFKYIFFPELTLTELTSILSLKKDVLIIDLSNVKLSKDLDRTRNLKILELYSDKSVFRYSDNTVKIGYNKPIFTNIIAECRAYNENGELTKHEVRTTYKNSYISLDTYNELSKIKVELSNNNDLTVSGINETPKNDWDDIDAIAEWMKKDSKDKMKVFPYLLSEEHLKELTVQDSINEKESNKDLDITLTPEFLKAFDIYQNNPKTLDYCIKQEILNKNIMDINPIILECIPVLQEVDYKTIEFDVQGRVIKYTKWGKNFSWNHELCSVELKYDSDDDLIEIKTESKIPNYKNGGFKNKVIENIYYTYHTNGKVHKQTIEILKPDNSLEDVWYTFSVVTNYFYIDSSLSKTVALDSNNNKITKFFTNNKLTREETPFYTKDYVASHCDPVTFKRSFVIRTKFHEDYENYKKGDVLIQTYEDSDFKQLLESKLN